MTNNTYAINIWVKKILMKNDNNKVSTVSIIRVAIYKFKAEQTRTSKKKGWDKVARRSKHHLLIGRNPRVL